MLTNPVTEPSKGSTPLQAASENIPVCIYETCCGLCGAQIHFLAPLTDWTKVYCPGCGEYVAVR